MRTLSSTLLEAQKSASSVPHVKVEVFDRIGGVPRLRFERHYTGSEPEDFHAATIPSDGSLIRARVAGSGRHYIYLQRVPNPTPTSDFGSWTRAIQVSSVANMAICSEGSRVLLAHVSSNKRSIYARQSDDNGQTYGHSVLIATSATSVKWMAVALKPDGTALFIYTTGAANLYTSKRTSSGWSNPRPWASGMSDISGVNVVYDNDWNVVLAGKDSRGRPGVWTAIYGDGSSRAANTWSSRKNLTIADNGSGLTFESPFIAKPGSYRVTFVERYRGSSSYDLPFLSFTMPNSGFSSNLWREPVPLNLTSTRGIAVAHGADRVWLSTPSGVWSAVRDAAPLDISQDVLSVKQSLSAYSGEMKMELRNDDGKYNSVGAGPLDMLQKGSEIRLGLGYRTSAGIEVSSGSTVWIESWEYRRHGGRSTIAITARDWWGLLETWKARRQFTWAEGDSNVAPLLAAVLARAGLGFVPGASVSAAMSSHSPSFTIHPGESAATAVKRLLSMVPDVVFFSFTRCTSLNPRASDPSAYSYGTDHPVLESRHRDPAPEFNRVQVFGASVFNESYDWTDMHLVYDRLRQVHDLNLNTSQKAVAQVARELRHQTMSSDRGEITVPANAGQELYDVVDVTDPAAGMQAIKRRVMGLRTEYRTNGNRPGFTQTLYLGNV